MNNKPNNEEINIDELSEITFGDEQGDDDIKIAAPVKHREQKENSVAMPHDPGDIYSDRMYHGATDGSALSISGEEDVEFTEEDFREAEKIEEDAIMLERIAKAVTSSVDEAAKIPEIDLSGTFPPEQEKSNNEAGNETEQEKNTARKKTFIAWVRELPPYVVPVVLAIVILLISIPVVVVIRANNAQPVREPEMTEITVTPPPTATPAPTEKPHIFPLIMEETPTPELSPVPTPEPEPRHESYSSNILILGEECINTVEGKGCTDLMMLLTINTKTNDIKFTSFMKDTLVALPEEGEMKLNEVCRHGGTDLLTETIKKNFLVVPDGYVKIGFDAFISIIDRIGGIEIELTEEEAKYLNKTNYISKEENRNVVKGINNLNGDQALGYARISKVGTNANEYNDFGRTVRQKRVVAAALKKLSGQDLVDLLIIMSDCLPQITTDLNVDRISELIKSAYGIGLSAPAETLRIPVAGSYKELRSGETGVLATEDAEANLRALHIHIFGDWEGDAEAPTEGPSLTRIPEP